MIRRNRNDITDLLKNGENVISVRVDYRSPNSRWYSGAGIYRRVWLKEYSDCHITNDGIYISADMEGNVTVTTEIEHPQEVSVSGLSVRRAVMDGGSVLAEVTSPCCAFDRNRITEYIYRDAEFCAGQFIWIGFDYIGEPTPYSTKNSYFGQIDAAGFPKDSAYIFRAEWTDYEDAPFVHIFPHWDFNEGQCIDVRVTSNAPKAALFFQGEKIAEKDIEI